VAGTWRVVENAAFFGVADEVVDDVMGGAELADFFLHGGFKDAFLFLDQGALLLVVVDARDVFAPVAAPPVVPSVLACGPAVGAGGVTFFTCGGAFGAGAEAAALVADDGD
jgi:hypothetical protein